MDGRPCEPSIKVNFIKCEKGKRFLIRSSYYPPLVTLCRSIPSKQYDPINKEWSFSIEHYKEFVQKAELLAPIVVLNLFGNSELFDRRQGVVRFLLVAKNRFAIQCSSDISLNRIFEQSESKRFDEQLNKWTFDVSDHDILVKYLRSVKCSRIESISSAVLDYLKTSTNNSVNNVVEEAGQGLVSNLESFAYIYPHLLPFQKSSVKFCIANNGRILLADDMGLGKTLQSICVASWYEQEWPLLIVCPAGLRRMWSENLTKWLPTLKSRQVNICNSSSIQISKSDERVCIVSFDTLMRHAQLIRIRKYQVVIVDESHYLKNMKAARTQMALPVLKVTTYFYRK
ncbi:hypothetical protein ACOME3_001332 [Neoechinorhynchus agilis]